MRSRRSQQEHDEAVSRRLAQLSAELATTRGEQPALAPAAGGDWWDGHTRVAPVRAPLVVVPREPAEPPDRPPGEPPGDSGEPPPVPVPGRHAARRGRWVLADAVPEPLRGRVGLGPAQVAVLAVMVALGIAATAWWVVRGDSEPVTPSAPGLVAASQQLALPVSGLPSGAASATGGAAVAPATTVTVDVAGKVRHPGIVVLDAGARVVDALEAAGGARPGVDLSTLNLARVLVDGEQVLVGRATAAPVVPGVEPPPGAPLTLVDLNRATQAELETLPEVGPVTAAAILAWRDEHGGFSAVDELLEVDGIGDATLAQIAPHVTV
jgi:competence protein ComEA